MNNITISRNFLFCFVEKYNRNYYFFRFSIKMQCYSNQFKICLRSPFLYDFNLSWFCDKNFGTVDDLLNAKKIMDGKLLEKSGIFNFMIPKTIQMCRVLQNYVRLLFLDFYQLTNFITFFLQNFEVHRTNI